jgi:hypothetical protein
VWDGGLKDSQENMGFMQEVGFHLNKWFKKLKYV